MNLICLLVFVLGLGIAQAISCADCFNYGYSLCYESYESPNSSYPVLTPLFCSTNPSTTCPQKSGVCTNCLTSNPLIQGSFCAILDNPDYLLVTSAGHQNEASAGVVVVFIVLVLLIFHFIGYILN